MKASWMFAALLCAALLPCPAKALFRNPEPLSVAQDRDHDRDHDWEHDRRFEGRRAGFRMGFQDGFRDGRADLERRHKWHYGPGYKHPDRGYRDEFGDRDDYKREYREGYEKGYAEGFGERH